MDLLWSQQEASRNNYTSKHSQLQILDILEFGLLSSAKIVVTPKRVLTGNLNLGHHLVLKQ